MAARRSEGLRRYGLLASVVIDVLCVVVAVVVSQVLYWALLRPRGFPSPVELLLEHAPLNVFVVFLYLLCFYVSGQYKGRRELFELTVVRLVLSLVLAILAVSGMLLLFSGWRYARINALLQALIVLLLVGWHRWASWAWLAGKSGTIRVAVLADVDQAAGVRELLSQRGIGSVDLIGFVRADSRVDWPRGYNVVGDAQDLTDLVQSNHVDEVLLASRPDELESAQACALAKLSHTGLAVSDVVSFIESHGGRIPHRMISSVWFRAQVSNRGKSIGRQLKRAFDILVAAGGLVLSLPVVAVAAVLIKLTSKGPTLYFQKRVGRGGKIFTLAKLRTMLRDAEQEGPLWAAADDRRVTRVGRFLRRARIDEIPQFWNVLKGDMSIVGPRPERPEFVRMLSKELPLYQGRLMVRPGITGWAQVHLGYASSVEESADKLQYDLYYVKNSSFLLDLAILGRTLWTVLTFSGS